MADNSHIEWTDATWNPTTGCSKVSAGCKHCYAERDWARLSANKATRYFGREFTDVQCHEDVLPLPLRWKKRRKIFVNSMSDLFHPDVPDDFIDDVFAIMARAERHTFQVLTKRPERMLAYLSDIDLEDRLSDLWREKNWLDEGWTLMLPLKNVWLGVSVEDQAAADERIPLLLQTPAAVRWISAEPLLGPLNLCFEDRSDGMLVERMHAVDWVVVGGESGPKARPMHPEWARSLLDQCAVFSAPFLFKQWGEWSPLSKTSSEYEEAVDVRFGEFIGDKFLKNQLSEQWPSTPMARVGKKLAGRLLDGLEHNGYPEVHP